MFCSPPLSLLSLAGHLFSHLSCSFARLLQPARSYSLCARTYQPCIATTVGVCERCLRLEKRGRLTYPCNLVQVVPKLSAAAHCARPSVRPLWPGSAPLFDPVAPSHDDALPKCSLSCLPQVPPHSLRPLGSDTRNPGGAKGTSHYLTQGTNRSSSLSESIKVRARPPSVKRKDPPSQPRPSSSHQDALPCVEWPLASCNFFHTRWVPPPLRSQARPR